MAYNAFEGDLKSALKDAKVRRFITDSRSGNDNADIYSGVLHLARVWNLQFVPLSSASPAGAPSVGSPPSPSP